jgi:transcriptional regulator with XRE-family HTH domain
MSRRSNDVGEWIRHKLAQDDQLASRVDAATARLRLASAVYDARIGAGLTQEQLANRIGTSQSVIARLEDADYDGHSLKILNRIADATGHTLHVTFDRKPEQLGSVADPGILAGATEEVEWPATYEQRSGWVNVTSTVETRISA